MNFEADSLSVLVAALDGHDPRTTVTHTPEDRVSVTTTGSRQLRDVDLAADVVLEHLAPRSAVVDVAHASHAVMSATAVALGHSPGEVPIDEVVHLLRTWLLINRGEEEVIQREAEDD